MNRLLAFIREYRRELKIRRAGRKLEKLCAERRARFETIDFTRRRNAMLRVSRP